jgi:6-phosphogluconolactonase
MKRSMGWTVAFAIGALCAMFSVSGCAGFFVDTNATGTGTCTGTGTGSTAGDFVYVGNASTGTLSGFAVGTGTLTAVPNTPFVLGFSPTALVVNPADTLLYVGGPNLIYVFAINSDGSVTALNSSSPVAIASVASMDISPDGQWLFVLDNNGISIEEYQINPSSGTLTQTTGATYGVASGTVVPRSIKVAPDGAYVFAALGTGGDLVFSFNELTGALIESQALASSSVLSSDNALAVSPSSNYLYIARSGSGAGVAVYAVTGGSGALTPVQGSPFAAGTQPFAIALNSAGTDVYVANRGDSTISGYSIGTNGVLAALAGSPYAAGSAVAGLAADKSGSYMMAIANGGAPDLSLYSFDATTAGKLDLITSTATGTDPTGPYAIAATH